jgi:hypothetical protein
LIWVQLSFVGISQVLQIGIVQKNNMVVFNPFNELFDAESVYCEKASVQVGQSVIEDDEFMGFLGGLEWRDELNDTLDEVLEVFLNLKFVESVFIVEGNSQHGGAEVPTESREQFEEKIGFDTLSDGRVFEFVADLVDDSAQFLVFWN